MSLKKKDFFPAVTMKEHLDDVPEATAADLIEFYNDEIGGPEDDEEEKRIKEQAEQLAARKLVILEDEYYESNGEWRKTKKLFAKLAETDYKEYDCFYTDDPDGEGNITEVGDRDMPGSSHPITRREKMCVYDDDDEIPDDIDEDDIDEYLEARDITGPVTRGSRGAILRDRYDLWDREAARERRAKR